METGRLQVKRALQRQKGNGLVFAQPKTPRSRRLIYLSGVAVDALRGHRALATGEMVFTNLNGELQESSSVTSALKVALDRAELPRIRVHDLRHTTATVLLEARAHPKLVQYLLGRSTVALTLKSYIHFTWVSIREAA